VTVTDTTLDPVVLVPVDVSSDEQPDPDLLELLSPVKVVLVGWYPVPDQTPLEQMREEYEAEAVERIETVADAFPETTDIQTVVVFTRNRGDTIDRVASDYNCDVVAVPDEVRVVERVLVPVRGDVNVDRIVAVVGGLLAESSASATLFHAVPEDEDPTVGETLLQGVADNLVEAGVDRDRVDTELVESTSPIDDIVDAAQNHDVLVVGETDPSLIEHVLGDTLSRVVDRTDRPVLVVRDVTG
jgi:nucleotide-binding universal stress UspA family protein